MKAFPNAGWEYILIENSTDPIAFNITLYSFQDILQSYAAPESTAFFCKTDEVMAELFPPGVRLQRPHTLGNGDDLCDFRYCDIRNRICLEK
ncbi:MAG: L-2-amino-thiazoline-4-carboxylic acid hydrolase [Chloroflexota bacterium]